MKIYMHVYVAITVTYFFAQVSWCEDLPKSSYLLPGNVIPSHYDVTWEFLDDCSNQLPQFKFRKTFTGDVRIILTATKPNVTAIELNCLGLNITGAVISIGKGSEYLELGLPECSDDTQKVTFHSPIGLPTSKNSVLRITFAGEIVTLYTYGMWLKAHHFRSAKLGQILVKESIGTLFEPATARRAFPCFDEPKYKATFRLALNVSTCVVKKGYALLSNTPLESVQEWDDRSIVYFKKTDFTMSTYLFAFSISPFISTPVKFFNSSFPDVGGTEWKELRTWGKPDVVKSWIGYVSQEVGARFLELFSRHLNIGYPLKKMDQVFNLYGTGILGMENWGVISYRPEMISNLSLVNLLGHEISHQWFGNLVTCRWWSEVWLNEGFATYFSFYGMDKLNEENLISCLWDPKLIAIDQYLLPALNYDQTSHTRALTTPVEDPSQYPFVFDLISYAKGASVIRMWSHVLGEKVFIKAIQKYLRNNKFGSSTPELLLEAFDSLAKESASNFGNNGLPSKYFKKWHTQSGYPVLEVTKSITNSSVYILTQKVFRKGNPEKVNWTIPISYSTDINKDFDKTHAMLWFKDQSETESIVLPSPVNWIIVNNQFTGFYRVKYDQTNYENLAQQLINIEKYREIHVANRIQIISDLFAFVKTDDYSDIDYRFFMDLSLYLKHETAYLPWKAALDYVIDYLNTMLGKIACCRLWNCCLPCIQEPRTGKHYEMIFQRNTDIKLLVVCITVTEESFGETGRDGLQVTLVHQQAKIEEVRTNHQFCFPVPGSWIFGKIDVSHDTRGVQVWPRYLKDMYVNDLLEDNYSKLTFSVKPGDSYNDKQLREDLVKWACKMDHPDCVRQSYYFVNTFSLGSQIHNKVYDTALCTNIRRNVDNDWDILWETYQSTSDFQERNVILHGISCSTDADILTRFLMKSLDETLTISEDERKSFFVAVLNSDPQNVDIALNFFSENYLLIEQMYGGNNPVNDLLLLLSKNVGTDEEVLKMEKITEVLEGEERVNLRDNVLSEVMEICKANNHWIKTKSQEVNVWLLSHYG